jgi:hypothetical protein
VEVAVCAALVLDLFLGDHGFLVLKMYGVVVSQLLDWNGDEMESN